MFAARVLRFIPVVANTRSSAGGLVLERLCAAYAAWGLSTLVVDAGEQARVPSELADASARSDVILVHASASELVRIFADRGRLHNLRPLVFTNDLAEGLTDAYAAVKVLSQRGGWMAYDLLMCAPRHSQQADQVIRRLSQCSDQFLGAAQRVALRLDPLEPASVDTDARFMELAAGLLHCALPHTLGETAFDHLLSPGAALPARVSPVLN